VGLLVPTPDAALAAQATIYKNVLMACQANSNCTALLTWGVSDANSWIPGTYPGFGAALLFNENYQAKSSYLGISGLLRPTTSSLGFSIADRGSVSSTSSGLGTATTVGYGRIDPSPSGTTAAGLAIFTYRPGKYLVSETGVPATSPLTVGRVYAEVNSTFDTGLAIANPSDQTATINFFFTDSSGNNLGSGSTTIGPKQQISEYFDSPRFHTFSGRTFQGTFSFTSTVPVAATAIRSFYNERNDFLLSTLSVIDTSAPLNSGTLVVPDFADGGGWTTQLLLINPTDVALRGTVEFRNNDGALTNVSIAGQANNMFAYAVPPRTSQKLATDGAAGSTTSGSVRISPSGAGPAPTPLIVFSNKPGPATVAQAGVPAVSGSAFRMYAESSGNVQTAIAIANNGPVNGITVTFEVFNMDGSTAGLPPPASSNLQGYGHTATFLSDVFPNHSLPNPFRGIVRISTTSASGISVVGVRSRLNELNDFLFTTTPPVDETAPASAATLLFPQLADGGGYTTQFVLFSAGTGQAPSGNLSFFSNSGDPLNLALIAR
jgi:hypothetical protein